MKLPNKVLLFCVICICSIGCDRVTKNLAKHHLQNREPISYWHNLLRLEYAENTGAFLGMGDHWPKAVSSVVFTILPLLVLTGVLIYAMKNYRKMTLSQMLPLALIFSGGVGNIIDRMLYDRHVTDFLNVGVGNFRTGIFNVADMYVTTALILMVVSRFRKRHTEENV
ncbi:MAG: signal peptidase II [Chitinophagaceae bacterium]